MSFEGNPWDPADPRNKDRTRISQRQVRAILLEWDPLGVTGSSAEDEYDCMISPLMHLLHDGATVAALRAWIVAERTGHFGLGPDDEADHALAKKLATWWAQRTGEPA